MFDISTQTRSNDQPENIDANGHTGHEQTPTALAEQLDALAKLSTQILRQQWCRFYKSQPPKRMSPDLLLLAVNWKVQARSLGGFSTGERRKLNDLSGKLNQNTTSNGIRLKPGTRLVREWHGDIHEILVLEKSFEWRGGHYRSLTLIAFQITGAHWSGPRFFGLKPKPDNFTRSKGRDTAGQSSPASNPFNSPPGD